jgi:hypothetical protein
MLPTLLKKIKSIAKKVGNKIDELHRQIGQLKVENDFLSRKLRF